MFTICLYNPKDDVFISRNVLDTGTFEPTVTIILKELFLIWPSDDVQKSILLDVGANLGIHGLYIANLGYRVWAIEPQERNLIKVLQTKVKVIV